MVTYAAQLTATSEDQIKTCQQPDSWPVRSLGKHKIHQDNFSCILICSKFLLSPKGILSVSMILYSYSNTAAQNNMRWLCDDNWKQNKTICFSAFIRKITHSLSVSSLDYKCNVSVRQTLLDTHYFSSLLCSKNSSDDVVCNWQHHMNSPIAGLENPELTEPVDNQRVPVVCGYPTL